MYFKTKSLIMKKYFLTILFLTTINSSSWSQSEAYQAKKEAALKEDSPFTKIINRQLPATIAYEDDLIIAFKPLGNQAPVHWLIVPKKPIPTINDIEKEDALLLGDKFLVAKKLAAEYGIAETGYRLSMNINEDAGQSVFHLHLHLMGGKKLGPMVNQE